MNLDDVERTVRPVANRSDVEASHIPAKQTSRPTYRRRAVVRAIGGATLVGLLAGCSGDGDDGGSTPNGGDSANSVDEWLADTGNYDGVVGRTETTSVTVEVGAQGNNGANAFAPAAIEIVPGTTVTWEWVDGYHNVVAADGEFNSGAAEQNATFQHSFESPGTYLYYCEPHRSIGMKGAVIVSGSDSGGSGTATTQSESQ